MKKFITALVLAVLSQQAVAIPVAGIDFLETADALGGSTSGSFLTNYTTPGQTPEYSGVDGNAATFTYGAVLANDSVLGASFDNAWDVSNVDLTLLLVGSNLHTGTVSLFGGSGGTSEEADFSLLPYDGTNFFGYTGFNSVSGPSTSAAGSTTLGIFALTIDLADTFGAGFGDFTGVQLQVTGANGASGFYDAAPSLIGVTSSAVVPVPAAVWLFGSGLIGLVGVARRKK